MTARALPRSSAGHALKHQPASRYPLARAAVPQPAPVRLFHRFARWWCQAGQVDLAWQEQRRLRDSQLLEASYRWITR